MGTETDMVIKTCNRPINHLEEIYFGIAEISPDAMVVVDVKGIILMFNKSAELMFGYHRNNVVGKNLEVLLPIEIREKHVKHLKKYFSAPHTREMGAGLNLSALHKDGHTFKVQIELSPMITKSSGLLTVAVIRRVNNNSNGDGDGKHPS